MLLAALLGALLWTLAEYLLHRLLAHRARGRNAFSREHLRHHARRLYFTPAARKLALALPLLGTAAALAGSLAGPTALAALAGFAAAWVAYETLHRRIHTHPPRDPYGRWARRHHLHHHFGNPWSNHGVTSAVWDHVFCTWEPPGRVGVPPHRAMPWLLDAAGEVRPDLRADYTLRPPGLSRDTEVG